MCFYIYTFTHTSNNVCSYYRFGDVHVAGRSGRNWNYVEKIYFIKKLRNSYTIVYIHIYFYIVWSSLKVWNIFFIELECTYSCFRVEDKTHLHYFVRWFEISTKIINQPLPAAIHLKKSLDFEGDVSSGTVAGWCDAALYINDHGATLIKPNSK